MTRVEFVKWAEQTSKKIDYKRFFIYRIPDDMDITICYDKKTKNVGITRCHPKDRFNSIIGQAIAYARCIGIEIPKIHKEKYLSNMEFGDKFYAQYKGKKAEYIFLGKRPDVTHSEWLAFPVDNSTILIHFFLDIKPFEMVE